MGWLKWDPGEVEDSVATLSDMILELMHDVVHSLSDPGFNEWFDAGIEIGDGGCDVESVIVYREMQETKMTDVNGEMRPGYILTMQLADGQQGTETFFEDDGEARWRAIADRFAETITEYLSWH